MQSDLLLLKRMLLTIVTFTGIALTSQGQIPLTIDKAMEICLLYTSDAADDGIPV